MSQFNVTKRILSIKKNFEIIALIQQQPPPDNKPNKSEQMIELKEILSNPHQLNICMLKLNFVYVKHDSSICRSCTVLSQLDFSFNTVCPIGFFGDKCDTECAYPWYGVQCGSKCDCADLDCHPALGCQNKGQIFYSTYHLHYV